MEVRKPPISFCFYSWACDRLSVVWSCYFLQSSKGQLTWASLITLQLRLKNLYSYWLLLFISKKGIFYSFSWWYIIIYCSHVDIVHMLDLTIKCWGIFIETVFFYEGAYLIIYVSYPYVTWLFLPHVIKLLAHVSN